MKDLGIQASQRISQSSDPLQSLADISQNFPNLASVLSRTEVSKEHRAELKRNQKVLPAGETFVFCEELDSRENVKPTLSKSLLAASVLKRQAERATKRTEAAKIGACSAALKFLLNSDCLREVYCIVSLPQEVPQGFPLTIRVSSLSHFGTGASFMLVNGMFVDPETNVYDLFAQLRREVSILFLLAMEATFLLIWEKHDPVLWQQAQGASLEQHHYTAVSCNVKQKEQC